LTQLGNQQLILRKYYIELFKPAGEGAGLEEVLHQHDNLSVARAIYRALRRAVSGRLVMLCDRARVWPAVIATKRRPDGGAGSRVARHRSVAWRALR
jgi:hypothetical protein